MSINKFGGDQMEQMLHHLAIGTGVTPIEANGCLVQH